MKAVSTPAGAPTGRHDRDDERELVRRAQQGDERAMHAIYRQQLPLVKRKLAAIVGADPELDDLIQTTFVRGFRQLGTFRGDARLSTWLCRIAINVSYDHLTSTRHKRSRRTVELDAVAAPDPRPAADELIAQRERSAALYRALERAKPASRVVFTLHEIEGHTIDEIAEMLGIGRNTVAARLRRTRKAVTRSLRQVSLRWVSELERADGHLSTTTDAQAARGGNPCAD